MQTEFAGQDKVNPGSLILSAEMMLRHMGWMEAADLIVSSMEAAISVKAVASLLREPKSWFRASAMAPALSISSLMKRS